MRNFMEELNIVLGHMSQYNVTDVIIYIEYSRHIETSTNCLSHGNIETMCKEKHLKTQHQATDTM